MSWTRTIPPDEGWSAEKTFVAVRFDGVLQLAAPLSQADIAHPVWGYAVRPGNWHWRKIDTLLVDALKALATDSPGGPPSAELVRNQEELRVTRLRLAKALDALRDADRGLAAISQAIAWDEWAQLNSDKVG